MFSTVWSMLEDLVGQRVSVATHEPKDEEEGYVEEDELTHSPLEQQLIDGPQIVGVESEHKPKEHYAIPDREAQCVGTLHCVGQRHSEKEAPDEHVEEQWGVGLEEIGETGQNADVGGLETEDEERDGEQSERDGYESQKAKDYDEENA